jgi:hypothetical protein
MPVCTAHTSAGNPCKKPAIKGGTVCATHGGSSPQVRRAADARLRRQQAYAEAARMVERSGTDADPLEILLDSLYHANQQLMIWEAMVVGLDAVSELEADERQGVRGELGYVETEDEDRKEGELRVQSRDRLLALDRHGAAQLHPYVLQRDSWADRRIRAAKLCVDAGIQTKRLEWAEAESRKAVEFI